MANLKTYRFSDLQEIIPVSRSTLWRWVRSGSFPPPISLGPNIRAWREADIRAWLDEKAVNDLKGEDREDVRLP
jgi:predicted DNA-binding transcriptional regulator AlpA